MIVAYKLPRPATAFSLSPGRGKRKPREKDDKHLAWLRTLPCIITGQRPVEACHVRYADPRFGKFHAGAGEKPHDKWAVPMLAALHREQHDGNERLFWAKYGIDPVQVASALYAESGNDEAAYVILRTARETVATMIGAKR